MLILLMFSVAAAAGSHSTVRAEQATSRSILDGVYTEEQAKLGEPIYADKARSREAGGAGLGLSIAKWIADAHRASIRVDSIPGQGSTFEFQVARQTAMTSSVRRDVATTVDPPAQADSA